MKKAHALLILFIFLAANIHSQENPEENAPIAYSPFFIHKGNYIIFGDYEDQVKAQFGFKYEIFKNQGFFLAYNQIMFWDYYDESSPVTEVTFSPELFWSYGDNINFLRLGFYEHKSNGKDLLTSRAWDRSYLQFRVSTGDFFNMGLDLKGFYMWNRAPENRDIDEYTGFYEAEIFFRFLKSGPNRLTDKEELYFRGGTGKGRYGFDYEKGWLEAGFKFRIVLQSIQPDFYIQMFYGYGEKLVAYNEKDFSLRIGFILK